MCSLRLRSSYQNTLRLWRDTHGSLLTLTAKVNIPQLILAEILWIMFVLLFTGNLETVWWVLWVTFIWSSVNTVLVVSFSDLPAWECFPAAAVSRGEFHRPHTCTVHRISWSSPSPTGKMAFMWRWWQWNDLFFLHLQWCQYWWSLKCVWECLIYVGAFNALNKNTFVKRPVHGETVLFALFVLWEAVKAKWLHSSDFICVVSNLKSVLQMACQEKDTESLKSLQTELW